METGIHELTAGYALDALEPADREAFERHLTGCERCQDELAGFWEVSHALAVAADGPAPSPGLRERILADARAEPQTVVPLESRRRLSPVLVAATAVGRGGDRPRYLLDLPPRPTPGHEVRADDAGEGFGGVGRSNGDDRVAAGGLRPARDGR